MTFNELIEQFSPTKCQALSDRTNIIFSTCCRGKQENLKTWKSQHKKQPPIYCNILEGFSDFSEFTNHQFKEGTPFIQTLLDEIEDEPDREIREILKIVQTRMSKRNSNCRFAYMADCLVTNAYFKQRTTSNTENQDFAIAYQETSGQAQLESHNPTANMFIQDRIENQKEICLVIINTGLKKQAWKEGSKDEVRILEVFRNILLYEVIALRDKTIEILFKEVNEIIENKIKRYHQNVIVCIFSYGDEDHFLTTGGGSMHFEDLIKLFLPANCPVLSDKPKIFLSSICRETQENGNSCQVFDNVHIIVNEADNALKNNKILRDTPPYRNVFLGYSTCPGFKSYRYEYGTVYMQTLLDGILKNPDWDIRQIHAEVQMTMFEDKRTKAGNYLIPCEENSLVGETCLINNSS